MGFEYIVLRPPLGTSRYWKIAARLLEMIETEAPLRFTGCRRPFKMQRPRADKNATKAESETIMGNSKRSRKELMGAALKKRLEEFQYKHWRYRERFGEVWPGVFDGVHETPQKRLLANCKVAPHRFDIISALPKGGVFAEIGTLHGDFIVQAVKLNQPAQVHLFDIDFSNIKPENRQFLHDYGNAVFHEGDSSSTLTELGRNGDVPFDVIYVDADHSYAGVWKDLTACFPLLKPDGYLVCNDYTTWDPISSVPYGVYWAVNRFANENDLALEYIALEGSGYHDVALRRLSAR